MNIQTFSDAFWAALAALVVVMIVGSHLGRLPIVRLSVLLRRLEAHISLYVVFMVAWMWMGWHFFAR